MIFKGRSSNVPGYLRYEGSVRVRHLSRRELGLLIDDIWKMRLEEKREEKRCDKMEKTVTRYFKEKFPIEEMRMEWAYGLHDSCQKLAHDE